MRIKPPALYLHRATINGTDRPVGSYTIDIRTKTVGRIFKATGVYPKDKNAAELVAHIHAMIHAWDLQRDDRRLGQIKLGKVKLLDALHAYKSGRLNAAEAHSGDLLAPSLWKWLKRYTASHYTTQQYTAHIRRLERMGLIKKSTTVRQVPDIVHTLRAKFNREHKAIVFQSIRGMFLSFLKSGLGYDDDSYVLKCVIRTPLVPIRHRREHHPLRSVHDLMDLCHRVNTAGRWKNRVVDYKAWIYFMVFTGLRPTEFERGVWSKDPATGHLLIHGTKTANARRIIPHVFFLEPKPRRLANLQMRLINLDPPTAVRARDFRRTAAVWYELAGIPRSRYSYYLGHGAKDITALYEQRVPTKDELDEDRAKLLAWVKGQKKTPRKTARKISSPTAATFIQSMEAL